MNADDVRFVRGAASWSDLPEGELPEVAFIGRSNVGKSSLLNMLVGRKALAHTSGTPGKTRQFNYYLVQDGLYLVDVPGFGYAKTARSERERWGRFIGRYLTERPQLRAAFHLVDARHAPTALDEDVMQLMKGRSVAYLIVLTKTDKLSANTLPKSAAQVRKTLAGFGMEVPIVLSSSTEKRGREELWEWIDLHAGRR